MLGGPALQATSLFDGISERRLEEWIASQFIRRVEIAKHDDNVRIVTAKPVFGKATARVRTPKLDFTISTESLTKTPVAIDDLSPNRFKDLGMAEARRRLTAKGIGTNISVPIKELEVGVAGDESFPMCLLDIGRCLATDECAVRR